MRPYPLVVIGAGAGGLVVANGFARAGKKVLLIEKGHWGGDCTNFGCIPSKTLIGAAKRKETGSTALQKVRETIEQVRSHEEPPALQKNGIEVLAATASFIDPHTLQAVEPNGATHTLRANKIVLATGSAPLIPSILGLKETPFLTNETVFNLKEPPQSMIVLGAGPIGSELAQAFQRLGTKVTVVHRHSHILGREPEKASALLIKKMQREGVTFCMNEELSEVHYQQGLFHCKLKGEKKEICAEQLLIASGRKPNLRTLELDRAKINWTEGGIVVDSYGRTSQKHIFALGDAVGPPFFTHLAENRARTVLTTLLLSPFWKKKIDSGQPIPRVTYTDPEIASIGLSQEEAIKKYGSKRVATYFVPLSEVDRAITQGEREGFIKIITRKWSSRILGATLACSCAGELLMEISLAIHFKIPLRKLSQLIHPYPTYSLAMRRAADLWLTQTLLPAFKKR